MSLILQVTNSPNIDTMCGAIVYAIHKNINCIYCTTSKISDVVKMIIRDYAEPLSILVTDDAPNIDNDSDIVLLGASTKDVHKYLKLASDSNYRFITNATYRVDPPNIAGPTSSICELLQSTFDVLNKPSGTDEYRVIVDLLYLGLAAANDRFLAIQNKETMALKTLLEQMGAKYEMAVRYLLNIISRKEMANLLPALSEYAIAGRDENVGIVSLPSGKHREQYEYITSLLQDVGNLTIAVVLVESELAIPMVYIRSVDSFFNSQEILDTINDKKTPNRLKSPLTVSSVLYIPEGVEDTVAYVKSKIDTLYNSCKLINGVEADIPNKLINLYHRNTVVYVLDLLQFVSDTESVIVCDNLNDATFTANHEFYEILPNGSLLPLTRDVYEAKYISTESEAVTDDIVDLDIDLITQANTVNITKAILRYVRRYNVVGLQPVKAFIPFESARIYSPLTGLVKTRGMLDLIVADTLTVVDTATALQVFEIK